MLTVLPIRYVADMAASRRFYEGLGLTYRAEGSVEVWAQLDAPAGAVGIHDAAVSKGRPPGTVELGFSTDQRLEDVSAKLTADGYGHTVVDEDFGRSIRVTDPDGVVIQIQEIDSEAVRRSQEQL
ncbi:VOC family protein [Nocardia sp. NPDC024068]|uniref:VOC family protein n=1 Tax=Nocardia sp. NPDC024068 TaxID=3157197 RepID=UPI0033F23629